MILNGKDYSAEIIKLDEFIDSLPTKKGKLISVLHHAQDLIGCLPIPLQIHIAKKLQVPPAQVYGVVTFYSFFHIKPKGKYNISVCMGTACFVRGSQDVLNEFQNNLGIVQGQTTEDGIFSMESIRCVGACGLSPVVSVNDKVYGRVTPQDVDDIINEHLVKEGIATHPKKAKGALKKSEDGAKEDSKVCQN